MYHFQRQILKEAEKYRKEVLDGTADKAMDNLESVDVVSEGGMIDEASSTTIVGYDRQSHGKEDLNKRTAENLRKYRVPPSFITNYGTLRKRKESLPGARIMWSKDDRDLDVIPAKDIQKMEADGWVIIEGVMSMGDDDFVIALG